MKIQTNPSLVTVSAIVIAAVIAGCGATTATTQTPTTPSATVTVDSAVNNGVTSSREVHRTSGGERNVRTVEQALQTPDQRASLLAGCLERVGRVVNARRETTLTLDGHANALAGNDPNARFILAACAAVLNGETIPAPPATDPAAAALIDAATAQADEHLQRRVANLETVAAAGATTTTVTRGRHGRTTTVITTPVPQQVVQTVQTVAATTPQQVVVQQPAPAPAVVYYGQGQQPFANQRVPIAGVALPAPRFVNERGELLPADYRPGTNPYDARSYDPAVTFSPATGYVPAGSYGGYPGGYPTEFSGGYY